MLVLFIVWRRAEIAFGLIWSEILFYAFVILFNFYIFLNVCIYSIYRVLTYSCSYFYLFVSRFG